MVAANDNYPMGVNGSHPYFNQPDPPECSQCYAQLDPEWLFCPWCGTPVNEDGDEECS